MHKIKRDDTVKVIAGKEKGKRGQVTHIYTKSGRIVVQGLNMVKRHERQRDERTPAGIIEKEGPIDVSNVKLICIACEQAVRVGFRVRSDGVKVRVCRSCGQDID